MNYTLSDLSRICNGVLSGNDRRVDSAVTDSRSFPVGDSTLFVAIRTRNRDGHDFVKEVYDRGVRAFLVERPFDSTAFPEAGFVCVNDTVAALQKLASHHRDNFSGKVVAITGSSGKTTVKEWIAQLVPPSVKLFRSPRSYNSQIGVPLSLLMIAGDEALAVIEAGISQPGEMEALARIIRPDIGIFTMLGDAHDENFTSRQEKLDEKLRLFRDCPQIIFNSDFEALRPTLESHCPNARLIDAATEKEAYAHFPDKPSQQNAAAALALCDTIGYNHNDSVARLAQLRPVDMRLEMREGLNDSIVVNDPCEPDIHSLSIALDYLARVAAGRKRILILSDLFDGTTDEKALYTRAARMIEEAGIDKFFGVGERISAHRTVFGPGASFFPTADELLKSISSETIAGRAILVKGAPGSGFDRIGHALERRSHTTVLEVNLDTLIRNLQLYRSRLRPGTKLIAMVKASSYGHGTFEIANTLQQQGVDYLAVAFADEGVTLRERGISMPIVVLNADADSFPLMVNHRLEPEIYNFVSLHDFIDTVRRQGVRDYPIHLKIDSGMHRLGFRMPDVEQLKAVLSENADLIRVSSVFSHLAVADDPTEDDYTRRQIETFDAISRAIIERLPYPVIRHIANTAAIERFPEAHFDMCRLGIGLYGIGLPGARKAATLKTRIVRIDTLQKGDTVGYGRAGVIERPSRIATIPIGYADGLNRRLGCGKWSVRVGDRPAPIVGRICMDSCMIDVTDCPDVREGDEAVIFSPRPGNSVEEMARVLETIPYEVMTSVSSRVKRIYTKE